MSVGEASIGLTLGTAQLDADTKTAERILNRIGRGVIENGKQAEKAIAQLSAAGVTSVDRLQRSFNTLNIRTGMDIENEKRKLTAAFEQIKNSGVASAKEIERAHASMKSKMDGLDAPIKSATGSFGGLSGAALAFAGGFSIQQVITQLHTAGMAAERLRNSFEAATGSAAKGTAEFGFARSEAQRLGLDLLTTSEAYLKLAASARGTALEGQKTRDIFSAVSGAGRSLGLSGDQMSGALLAISQMMSKGTVQAEELRGQLGERLPGAFNIAARAMGVTTAELGKMLEGGKVISEDFLPKFAMELEKTFPPGEKAMNGMTAETMRLKTAWYELKATVMEGGGESMFTNAIRGMKDLVKEADSFYGRMSGAWRLLKDFAKNPMDKNLGGSVDVAKLPPLTKFDIGMTGIPDVGTSIGSLVDRGRAGKLKPMMVVDAEARAAQEEEMKKGGTSSAKIRYSAFENDHYKTLIKGIDEYNKKLNVQQEAFYGLSVEIDNAMDAEKRLFNLQNMQSGDLKTGRYNVTPLSSYKLRTNDQYSIPQGGVDQGKVDADAKTAAQLRIRMNKEISAAHQTDEATRIASITDELNTELEMRIDAADKMIGAEEDKWALMLLAEQAYNAKKKKLEETNWQAVGTITANNLGMIGDMMMKGNKRQFEEGKKFAIASAMMNTYMAASNAFVGGTKSAPGPWGVALGVASAALAVGAGMMQVAQIDSQQYQARALGGPVTAGQTYIVNENRSTQGPEYFTPGVSGTITPANKIGGNSTSVTQVLQISAGVTDTVRAEISRLMPLIRQQAVSAVVSAQRNGQM